MNLLALDCAGAACSAAVVIDGAPAAVRTEAMARGQAARIVPMLDEVLREAGVTPASLDAVAATVGPGAFTGVRIGLSAAQGLARAAGCPGVGVTVTAALADAVPVTATARLLVAVDSRRADPFGEWFDAVTDKDGTRWRGSGPIVLSGDPASWAKAGDGPVILAGDAADAVRAALGRGVVAKGDSHPDPVRVALRAGAALAGGHARPLSPIYLRAPDVSAPSRDRARRPVAR